MFRSWKSKAAKSKDNSKTRKNKASSRKKSPARLGFESLEPRIVLSASDLLISEFMAKAAGTAPDWIEVYNPTTTAVSLHNYYLTDNASDLKQWRFPDNILLGAGEYIVVNATGTSQKTTAPFSTNFKKIESSRCVFGFQMVLRAKQKRSGRSSGWRIALSANVG